MSEDVGFALVEDDVAGFGKDGERDDEQREGVNEDRKMQRVNVCEKDHAAHRKACEDVHPQQHEQSGVAAHVLAGVELHEGPPAAQVLLEINADERRQLPRVNVEARQRVDDEGGQAHRTVPGFEFLVSGWGLPSG